MRLSWLLYSSLECHQRTPLLIVQACQAELRSLVAGWQACRAQRSVEVRFWCCDAIALCSSGQLAVESRGGSAVSGSIGGAFDVIATSNVGDHVGQWNLLAACAPLLRAAPHARWATVWAGTFVPFTW